MSEKTLQEEMEALKKSILEIMTTDFYNMWTGVALLMPFEIIRWIIGFEISTLTEIGIALTAMAIGYFAKIGTRFFPIKQYFLKEESD